MPLNSNRILLYDLFASQISKHHRSTSETQVKNGQGRRLSQRWHGSLFEN